MKESFKTVKRSLLYFSLSKSFDLVSWIYPTLENNLLIRHVLKNNQALQLLKEEDIRVFHVCFDLLGRFDPKFQKMRQKRRLGKKENPINIDTSTRIEEEINFVNSHQEFCSEVIVDYVQKEVFNHLKSNVKYCLLLRRILKIDYIVWTLIYFLKKEKTLFKIKMKFFEQSGKKIRSFKSDNNKKRLFKVFFNV